MNNHAISPALIERARKVSDELLVLVLDAFQQGRRVGAARLAEQLGAYCQRLLDEFERTYDALTPKEMELIQAKFEALPAPPAVAARFGAAAEIIELLRGELARLENTSERPAGRQA